MDMRDISTEAIDRAAEIVPEQIRAGLHDRRVRRNLSDATGSALRLGRRMDPSAPREILTRLARDRTTQEQLADTVRSLTATFDAARTVKRRSRIRRLTMAVMTAVAGLAAMQITRGRRLRPAPIATDAMQATNAHYKPAASPTSTS